MTAGTGAQSAVAVLDNNTTVRAAVPVQTAMINSASSNGGGLLTASQHPGATRHKSSGEHPNYFNERNNGHIASDGGFVARLDNPKFGSQISTYKTTSNANVNTSGTQKNGVKNTVLKENNPTNSNKNKASETQNGLSKEQLIAKNSKDFILKQVEAGEAQGGQLSDGRNVVKVLAELNKKLGLPPNHSNGIILPE